MYFVGAGLAPALVEQVLAYFLFVASVPLVAFAYWAGASPAPTLLQYRI